MHAWIYTRMALEGTAKPLGRRRAMVPHQHRTNHCPRDHPHLTPSESTDAPGRRACASPGAGCDRCLSARIATRERREQSVGAGRVGVFGSGCKCGCGRGRACGRVRVRVASLRRGERHMRWLRRDESTGRGLARNVNVVGARAVVHEFLTEPTNWNCL